MFTKLSRLAPLGALLALAAAIATPADASVHLGTNLPAVTPCTGATIAPSPASPQAPATQVTLTAGATCSGSPEFRFLVQPPGGTWKVVREYSDTPTYVWDTTNLIAGTYGLEVEVRNQGTTTNYDTIASTAYRLAVTPCDNLSMFAIPQGQSGPTQYGNTGTPIVVRADYYVPPGGGSVAPFGCANPQLRFWMRPPGGAWRIVQDYSSSTYYYWDNTQTPGIYYLEADAREQLEGNRVPYDIVANLMFVLLPCRQMHVIFTSPASPQAPGSNVTIGANNACLYSGGGGLGVIPNPTPTYRFWMRYPGQAWMIVQDYSTSSQFLWYTASLPPGRYAIEVDERMQGVTASYETTDLAYYTLAVAACTTPTLGASPASPSPAGTKVLFTATTSGCANPRYRFWVQSPNGVWTMVQDYSTANTFDWTTTYAAGGYNVEVDVRDQLETGVAYDSTSKIPYQLT